jgi:hypothetical protein
MTAINKDNNDPNLALYHKDKLIRIPLNNESNGIIKKDL